MLVKTARAEAGARCLKPVENVGRRTELAAAVDYWRWIVNSRSRGYMHATAATARLQCISDCRQHEATAARLDDEWHITTIA